MGWVFLILGVILAAWVLVRWFDGVQDTDERSWEHIYYYCDDDEDDN